MPERLGPWRIRCGPSSCSIPEVMFLSHGVFGACPRAVFERYQAWQLELERQPVEFLGRRLTELLAEARAAFARLRRRATRTTSSSSRTRPPGSTSAARSLDLGPGDEVLSTDLEYGALNFLWERLCAKAGARFVRAPISLPTTGPDEIVEAVWAHAAPNPCALREPDHVGDGARPPGKRSSAAAPPRRGSSRSSTGRHVPGQLPLDLAAFGADLYVGNCHKWLCAPKGSAFLWVRPELQESIEALALGWGFGEDSTFLTRNERQGTRDPAAYLAVPEAIRWQDRARLGRGPRALSRARARPRDRVRSAHRPRAARLRPSCSPRWSRSRFRSDSTPTR